MCLLAAGRLSLYSLIGGTDDKMSIIIIVVAAVVVVVVIGGLACCWCFCIVSNAIRKISAIIN